MPLPGESIIEIRNILSISLDLLERTPETDHERKEIEKLITKAKVMVSDEEMEVIRFGDVTRISDHTYEPYNTVRQIVELLEEFQVPEFEVDGAGNKEVDQDGSYILDHWGCFEMINVISSAIDILDEYINGEQFPNELSTNQPELQLS
jgi:hypothetical protein